MRSWTYEKSEIFNENSEIMNTNKLFPEIASTPSGCSKVYFCRIKMIDLHNCLVI